MCVCGRGEVICVCLGGSNMCVGGESDMCVVGEVLCRGGKYYVCKGSILYVWGGSQCLGGVLTSARLVELLWFTYTSCTFHM